MATQWLVPMLRLVSGGRRKASMARGKRGRNQR